MTTLSRRTHSTEVNGLCEPEFSFVGLAVLQVHVELVCFLDNFLSGFLVKAFLIEAEGVKWLVIRGLVPSEPLSDAYEYEGDEKWGFSATFMPTFIILVTYKKNASHLRCNKIAC